LLARVKALLRRAEPPSDSPRTIEVGKLAIDPASYRVSHSGKAVPAQHARIPAALLPGFTA